MGLLLSEVLSLVAIVFSCQNEYKLIPKENASEPEFLEEFHMCRDYQIITPTPKREWEREDCMKRGVKYKNGEIVEDSEINSGGQNELFFVVPVQTEAYGMDGGIKKIHKR